MERVKISETVSGIRMANWTPGNGTVYQACSTPFGGDLGVCGVGELGHSVLVTSGTSGRSYILTKEPKLLHHNYVQEKFYLSRGDTPFVTFMLGKLLDRPTSIEEADLEFCAQHDGCYSPRMLGEVVE
jgi:hypothetical protein